MSKHELVKRAFAGASKALSNSAGEKGVIWVTDSPIAAKKASSKGKRYTDQEKQRIVAFVNQHNAPNGRGGATAASKKFGVSQLTVASWLKGSGGASVPSGRKGSKTAASGSRSGVLAELAKLDAVIAAKRRKLDALGARFNKLEATLVRE